MLSSQYSILNLYLKRRIHPYFKDLYFAVVKSKFIAIPKANHFLSLLISNTLSRWLKLI